MDFLHTPKNIALLFDEIINQIIPTDNELNKFNRIIENITKIIENSEIPKKIKINFIEPQGSTGIKQTSLKKAADIDLFIGIDPIIIFSKNFQSKKKQRSFLKKLFKNLTKTWLKPCLIKNNIKNVHLSYAEHPYISATYEKIELDIVICFDLSEDFIHKNGPITAVDRTPHHSRFIRETLDKKQKNDVRLLKHFFKCHHCYGDKSAVGRTGFIGYSAEILIAYYENIWTLFNHFSEINNKIIYSPKFHNNNNNNLKIDTKIVNQPFNYVKKNHFPNDYLIILDPTDLDRNLGSSISHRAYRLINEKIFQFLQEPSKDFFIKHPIKLITEFNLSKEDLSRFFYVQYAEINQDHYTKFRDKLYSLMNKIIKSGSKEKTEIKRFGDIIGELLFKPKKGEYSLAFYTKTPNIGKSFLRKGPKIKNEPHSSKFKNAHSNCFEKNGFLYLKVTRTFNNFGKFLKEFVKIHGIKNLELINVGCAKDPIISSEIAKKSMGNLYSNILHYSKKS